MLRSPDRSWAYGWANPMALQRLKEEAEKAKIALSSAQSVDINLPFITADASRPKHLNVQLSRAKMEQICDQLFERCVQPFKSCLKDADLTAAKIDELVLVGGMTRMPKVVDIAKQLGGKPPHQGVNPDEVVAVGAAVQGGVLKGEVRDVLLLAATGEHTFEEISELLGIPVGTAKWRASEGRRLLKERLARLGVGHA